MFLRLLWWKVTLWQKEPYQEFRKGVDIVTYQKDSIGAVDATLTANYAIHYGNRKLWEAKGNVVVKKSNGQEPLHPAVVLERENAPDLV